MMIRVSPLIVDREIENTKKLQFDILICENYG